MRAIAFMIICLGSWTIDAKYHECFECNDIPREEESEDEDLGSCPGWNQRPKRYGDHESIKKSLYDGCMTISLVPSGRIVAQNAVVMEYCNQTMDGNLKAVVLEAFGSDSKVECCLGSLCNGLGVVPKHKYFQIIEKVLIGGEAKGVTAFSSGTGGHKKTLMAIAGNHYKKREEKLSPKHSLKENEGSLMRAKATRKQQNVSNGLPPLSAPLDTTKTMLLSFLLKFMDL